MKFVCVWIVLGAFGCVREKVEEPTRSVEISLQTEGRPAAGVPVKVIDETGAAKAIVPLASSEDLQAGIPEANYGDFFKALKPADGTGVSLTDRAGKVVIDHLRGQHFIAAYDGKHLWVAEASGSRDRKLPLGAESLGGQHALDVLVFQPAVLQGLTAATLELMRAGKFDQARVIARTVRSKVLLAEVDRSEAGGLFAQVDQAMQQKQITILPRDWRRRRKPRIRTIPGRKSFT